MGFSYNVNVLNQKGSPAIYTDTFANRPAFGFAGRLFIANDTAAIYEDTGTAWVLIANVSSGAGTLQQVTTNGNTSNVGISVTAGGVSTNSATITSLTTGSVPFVGAAGLITQDNTNLFFDDTNNRLGINTNAPSNNLDVHGAGTTALIALNNTAGNQSLIAFAKNSSAKWRIGNSSTDTFDILNVGLTTNAISINSASNCVSFLSNLLLKQGTGFQSIATFNGIACDAGGFFFNLGTSTFTAYLNFIGLTAARTFTFPDATGTLALTSNIPTVSGTTNYIPKFTGSSAIGNSTIFETGTSRVGINTVSPGQQLSIVPLVELTTNTSGQFSICESSNNANFRLNFGYYLLGNHRSFIQSYAAAIGAVLEINPNGGNVLIGLATDDTINKLQVNGSANFAASNITTTNSVNRSVNVSLPGSTTTTVLRFLNNAGTLNGQNAIFGILNIFVGWNAGYNFGSNVYAYSISCSSNGVGVLTLLSSNIVGSSLVTSVAAAADGTGCKINITTNAVANALGANCWVTFNGNYF